MADQRCRDRGIVRSRTTLLVLVIVLATCAVATSAAATGGVADAVQDPYEPENDEISTAPTLEPGTYTGLRSEQRDYDYYAVEVAAGERLVANISFDNDAGNLDLILYRNGISDEVAASRSISGDTERIVFDPSETDTYYVQVSGYDSDTTYDLGISVDELPPRDQFEPNDDRQSAAAIEPGTYENLGIIDGENDVYTFEAQAGDEIAARTTFEQSNGDLDLRIYAPNEELIGKGDSLDATEESANATANTTGTYLLTVSGMAGATTTYELEFAVGADAASQIGSGGGGSGSSDNAGDSSGSGSGVSSDGSAGSSGGSSGTPGFGAPAAFVGITVALIAGRHRFL